MRKFENLKELDVSRNELEMLPPDLGLCKKLEKLENSPLKPELKPWPRGSWDECGTATTRVGLIGRKIGVVPMWLKSGKPVLATMLHIEDNHVIRYISAEDFSQSVVAQRRIRPYIMKPTASISRGSVVVGALSADPSKFTKDYCGLFTESGLMPKKKLVRFPGKYYFKIRH